MKSIISKFVKLKSSIFLFLKNVRNIELYERASSGIVSKLWCMSVDRPEIKKNEGVYKLKVIINGNATKSCRCQLKLKAILKKRNGW
jgi:hypothetical protein